ncbi:MAG: HD family phosphohydrolase [Leptospiraceae bacterium]|nr:MAG: HD family phosphohydrolase [Leptospiraceae bacterium]
MSISLKEEVQEKLKNLDRLPSFPEVVHKVLKMIRNPEVEFKDIAKEIVKDPGLTSDIIRLSNSAYYHPTKEIRSIDEAIKVLGLKTLKEIILVAAARGILKQPVDGYKLESRDMWEHSLTVAYLSMQITEDLKLNQPPKDVSFTTGLMHDCGKIVLASTFKKALYMVQLEYQKNTEISFISLEKKFIGYSHPEIGAFLLKKWNFPDELIDSVLHIYEPEKSKINPILTSIVHIANWIAISAGIGIDVMGMNESLSDFALRKLNFNNDKLSLYYNSIPEFLDQIKDLIDL